MSQDSQSYINYSPSLFLSNMGLCHLINEVVYSNNSESFSLLLVYLPQQQRKNANNYNCLPLKIILNLFLRDLCLTNSKNSQ